jgi:5-methylcytosine-specific restriction endonuclease McrA
MKCQAPTCNVEFAPLYVASRREKRYCSQDCRLARNRVETRARRAAHCSARRKEIAAQTAAYRAAHREEIRAQEANKRAERRAECIAYLGGKCIGCGATSNLEIDHKNPASKSFTIGQRLFCSWATLLAELAKCHLLCKRCHARKSAAERSATAMLRALMRQAQRKVASADAR